ITLLESFISDVMLVDSIMCEKTAIGIDARNQSESLLYFAENLDAIRNKGIDCEIIFLQAEEAVLLKRYSETRRKHPLTDSNIALQEALKIEQDMLKPVFKHANIIIDTSRTHLYQLRELVKSHVEKKNEKNLSIQFQSFGYKYGIPLDADFVFDARCLPNPYWNPGLRGFTGKDNPVIDFLNESNHAVAFLQDICDFLEKWLPRFEEDSRSYLTVAIGCTGGQHRSVYLVESLVEHFKNKTLNVIVRHRELH
ncbi:MAG: RNase adapter RapZ, partial [Methylococcales bacterium]|nr:RNase adapter RapZ [Methylococcales bacterium]